MEIKRIVAATCIVGGAGIMVLPSLTQAGTPSAVPTGFDDDDGMGDLTNTGGDDDGGGTGDFTNTGGDDDGGGTGDFTNTGGGDDGADGQDFAADDGGLADTGSSTAPATVLGGALLVIGGSLLFLNRRRA